MVAVTQAATLLYTLEGGANNDAFGSSIVGLGDLNSDGFGDLAIGDPLYDVTGTTSFTNSGQVLIVSGKDGTTLFTLNGTPATEQRFGTSLVALHADGDSKLDLAVGAPGGNGAVYIYSGADGSLIRTLTDATPEAGSQFGAALAVVGDQNADGKADLVVGAPGSDTNDGRVFVFSAATGALLNEIAPTLPDGEFGAAIAGISDFNGDGKADLVVGSPAFSGDLGRVQVIDAVSDAELDVRVGTLAGAQLGATVGAVGDRNSDGKIDVVIGSATGGSAFLVSGANLDDLVDLTLAGGAAGQPVVSGGAVDVEGDGDTELLIGYPGALPFARVSVVPSPTLPEPNAYEATVANTGLGLAVAVIPDLGFAIGEPFLGNGAVHVYVSGGDNDDDGVPNELDHCPDSILTDTVIIGGIDTKVENTVDEDGCSIADLIAELEPEGGYKNHGQFVSKVTKLIKSLRKEGEITKSEAQALQKAAAMSNVGKKAKAPKKPKK